MENGAIELRRVERRVHERIEGSRRIARIESRLNCGVVRDGIWVRVHFTIPRVHHRRLPLPVGSECAAQAYKRPDERRFRLVGGWRVNKYAADANGRTEWIVWIRGGNGKLLEGRNTKGRKRDVVKLLAHTR